MNKKFYKIIFAIFSIILTLLTNSGFLISQNNYLKNYTIEHLCFNTLIAFPDKALNNKNNMSEIYDKTKITTSEFLSILNELYHNDFILINIDEIYEKINDKICIKNLVLPANKKPLILSFDNVSYKSNYQNLGEIDKIIVDRNNNIATYTTKKSIQDRVQYDNEFVVILENFIKSHSDFSYNGARGIIFCTGENGLLGYNTNHKNAQNKFETKKALQVVTKLKNLGWKFGCNNYKFFDDNSKTEIELAKEIELWNKEIGPIVGDTNLYAFPTGNKINSSIKLDLISNNGFDFFFSLDKTPSLQILDNKIFMSRRLISGETLRQNTQEFSHLFDCGKVYDHTNRITTFL